MRIAANIIQLNKNLLYERKIIMKTTKRILACLMILAMLAAMLCVGASAATININGTVGATYTAYKVFDVAGTSKNAVLYTWTTGLNDTFKTDLNGYVTETITGEEYLKVTDAIAFAEAVINHANKPIAADTAILPDTLELSDGYYVMKSSVSSVPYAFSIIDGKLAGEDPNYTSATNEIKEKSKIPNVTITVEEDSTSTYGSAATAEIEQKMNYKIMLTVAKNGVNYVVSNTLDSQLTLDTTSVEIKFDGADVSNTNYTLNATASGLEITFKDAYIASLETGNEIVITYDAMINNTAADNTPYKSNVVLYHGENIDSTINGAYGDLSVDAAAATVKTFALDVFKHNASDAPLAGAKFTLGTLTFTEKTTNVYVVDPDGIVNVITTDDTGRFTIIGLDADSYALTETQAPTGYHGVDPINVNVPDGAKTEVKVLNQTGAALPETGGIGTTVFYAVGGLLVLGAVVVLLMKKRRVTE